MLVAPHETGLVGMIELRRPDHIAMLFVDGRFQRRGIARALVEAALDRLRAERPGLDRLTVHASPNAVPAYRRLGFRPTAGEQSTRGIRFIPMARRVDD